MCTGNSHNQHDDRQTMHRVFRKQAFVNVGHDVVDMLSELLRLSWRQRVERLDARPGHGTVHRQHEREDTITTRRRITHIE